MNKNSIEKDFLSDVVDLIEEEWIEYAADYKESSKTKAFPFYKFVNVAAVLIISIVSAVVFMQISPINRIGEQIISTTDLPKLSDDPKLTEYPVKSSEPDYSEKPVQTENLENTRNFETENVPIHTYKPLSTNAPMPTDSYDEAFKTIAPTRQPEIRPSKAPAIHEPQEQTPEPTQNISNVVTNKPTVEPESTQAPTPDPVPIIKPTPQETTGPERPNESPTPIWTPDPLPTCTVEPTPTPTPEPTVTPIP